ncbi:Asparagine-rich zinc finger protein, partial [Lachnellula suecica]
TIDLIIIEVLLCTEQDNTATLAVIAHAPGQAWGRWPEQHNHQHLEPFYAMGISEIVLSYDPRAVFSPALNRTVMAPQYVPVNSFSGAPSNNMVASHHQLQQHNPFSYGAPGAYSGGNSTGLVPSFGGNMNYIRQRPLPHLMQTENDGSRGLAYNRNSHQGFVEERHRQSPPIKHESIKPEPQWNTSVSTSPVSSIGSTPISTKTIVSTVPIDGTAGVDFGTTVDTLMKAIQAKAQNTSPQTPSTEQKRPVVGASLGSPFDRPTLKTEEHLSQEASTFGLTHGNVQDETTNAKGSKKRYQCTMKNCSKSFYQKTHLDIHVRAHTGAKPYPCRQPNCGRSFSQLGNLKTHERRHTGERPYQCDTCGKRFAQRGNVRAHRIVHDQAKPYLCRLDDCSKQFTQLGNLKSHQNKFHIPTIQALTHKFASIKDGDIVHAADKELWEYFANLYKNSNKGIKGRGRDRKVGPVSTSLNSSLRDLGVGGNAYHTMSGAGRGNMVVGIMSGVMGGAGRGQNSQYEMFDADDGSQSSTSGSGSSCYDDAPSDGFEDNGRNNELAFGDRIY